MCQISDYQNVSSKQIKQEVNYNVFCWSLTCNKVLSSIVRLCSHYTG